MKKKCVKLVQVVAIGDEYQIQSVLAYTLDSSFLPIQLVVRRKLRYVIHSRLFHQTSTYHIQKEITGPMKITIVNYLLHIKIPYVERT